MGTCYSIELRDGKVTLRHRMADPAWDPVPALYWRSGAKLFAWSPNGLCGDLLSSKFTFTEGGPTPYGWNKSGDGYLPPNFTSIAEVQGRRFVIDSGLHEIDADGTVLRSWWAAGQLQDWGGGTYYRVPLPQDCPIQSGCMLAMGNVLVFVARDSILAWDPKDDTWYGPLSPGGENPVAVPGGLWLSGLRFIAADDLFAKAKSAGRVMTTAQYRQRQEECVAAMPLLDRAKAVFTMHRFDKAQSLLEQVLKDDPASAEALLLMGWLHDQWCMNEPETALKYYRRLAGLTDPSASAEGWYQQLCLLGKLKRWPETLAAAEQIRRRFPRFNENDGRNVDWWRDEARKHVSPAADRKAETKEN